MIEMEELITGNSHNTNTRNDLHTNDGAGIGKELRQNEDRVSSTNLIVEV